MFGQMRSRRPTKICGCDCHTARQRCKKCPCYSPSKREPWYVVVPLMLTPLWAGLIMIFFLHTIPHYFGWDIPEQVCQRWINCTTRITSTGRTYDACTCEKWVPNPAKEKK